MAKVVCKVGKVAPERARLSKCLYATEVMHEIFMRIYTQFSGQSEKYKVGLGSMDIVCLYPALEKEKVKTILKEMLGDRN